MPEREHIVEKCMGCEKVDGNVCKVYLFPPTKWRIGNCPMATHIGKIKKVSLKVNPLKASKRNVKDKIANRT